MGDANDIDFVILLDSFIALRGPIHEVSYRIHSNPRALAQSLLDQFFNAFGLVRCNFFDANGNWTSGVISSSARYDLA